MLAGALNVDQSSLQTSSQGQTVAGSHCRSGRVEYWLLTASLFCPPIVLVLAVLRKAIFILRQRLLKVDLSLELVSDFLIQMYMRGPNTMHMT